MKSIQIWRCLVPTLLLSVLLTSCGNEGTGGAGPTEVTEPKTTATSTILSSPSSPVQSGGPLACVDWVRFETPQNQYDNAALVLIGKSVSQAGETSIYGHRATTHLVEVEQILKGDPGEGNLHITSTPPTCTAGESYPDGDPLDTAERVIIFASKQGSEWFTITPAQGVLPFPQGSNLPFP
ncbi:hypothetical protein OVA06_13760 [Pseudarthrobacter sp. SL88]|uniref:hypothetical protein n=1 Tax=Pseudarthrobacter sp. SL88 TaxID=2994666 RepID=UPI00227554CF|nr:hypothetical protein [Pseudarthrobacter sp. SL88]MCY1675760.1 hypothetical protein [Pseudarthrobacter sp. SL88]